MARPWALRAWAVVLAFLIGCGSTVTAGGDETSSLSEDVPTVRDAGDPDPCNRDGLTNEDLGLPPHGCACPFECPDPGDPCLSRLCYQGRCELQVRPYEECLP